MSSALAPKPKKTNIAEVEPVEQIERIKEEPLQAERREKKRLARSGKQTTIISGITSALKTRLG